MGVDNEAQVRDAPGSLTCPPLTLTHSSFLRTSEENRRSSACAVAGQCSTLRNTTQLRPWETLGVTDGWRIGSGDEKGG